VELFVQGIVPISRSYHKVGPRLFVPPELRRHLEGSNDVYQTQPPTALVAPQSVPFSIRSTAQRWIPNQKTTTPWPKQWASRHSAATQQRNVATIPIPTPPSSPRSQSQQRTANPLHRAQTQHLSGRAQLLQRQTTMRYLWTMMRMLSNRDVPSLQDRLLLCHKDPLSQHLAQQ